MKSVEEIRSWLSGELGVEVTDATGRETCARWDSLITMQLTFMVEDGRHRLTEAQIADLVSWPAVVRACAEPFRKVLVLDADGTLWDGVYGEGEVSLRLDRIARWRALQERGVLLALCSRNAKPPPEAYTALALAVSETGVTDKAASLRKIASTLNVGLDSLVFVDDQPFEREAVATQLGVTVAEPDDDLEPLFPLMVDTDKTRQYHALAQAQEERVKYATEEEFLRSLEVVVTIHENRRDEVPRIAELCQKSNQFNLTVRRHTEAEVANEMRTSVVRTLHYRDRFGDQGLTGVLIVRDGLVDTFLLSCRVLGRGVEWAPWAAFRDVTLRAFYEPTDRNGQVADFWDRLGLRPFGPRWYEGKPARFAPEWIEVIYE